MAARAHRHHSVIKPSWQELCRDMAWPERDFATRRRPDQLVRCAAKCISALPVRHRAAARQAAPKPATGPANHATIIGSAIRFPPQVPVMPAPSVISFEGVGTVLAGHRVLDGISLAVAQGEFLAILGPSGAGKTTLMRLINRLAEASEGAVRVEGEDVRTADPIGLRRRIGYVFQNIGLFPHMTVAENIAITPRLLGWDAGARAARVDELIGLVRLDRARHRDRFPHQLSGGERQRVGIARALAARPRIVLMDEPFGALDPLTRDFRELHDALGLTSVMITHDALEAVLLADRIVVVRGGKVIADAAPRAL